MTKFFMYDMNSSRYPPGQYPSLVFQNHLNTLLRGCLEPLKAEPQEVFCWFPSTYSQDIWAAAFIYDVAAVKKIDGVPPPRFNLVFQVSALFHHEWPRFHHEWPRFNLILKCFKPTSFLESPHVVLISFCRRNQHFHKPCLTPHLVFIIVNKCSCSFGKLG